MRKLLSTETRGNSMRRLLSTRQAGEYLGVNSSTVRRLIYAGDLPVLRCFKTFRLDKNDLDSYIANEKVVL